MGLDRSLRQLEERSVDRRVAHVDWRLGGQGVARLSSCDGGWNGHVYFTDTRTVHRMGLTVQSP